MSYELNRCGNNGQEPSIMNIETPTKDDESAENSDEFEFNGETYTDYIEVNGEKIPEFPERLESAESYRNVSDIGRALADKIGDSYYSSAVFNEDDERFPNEAIGQSEDSDMDLESAISPGHYWYRCVGNYQAKKPFQQKFHEECEELGLPGNLEVYKKNFPVAIDMESGEEFEIHEEMDDEWEHIQVSPEWVEEYGGMPEVVMEKVESEPESDESEDDIPDSEWEKLNSDSKRIKMALDSKPELLDLEMKVLIPTLQGMPDMTTGESNVRKHVKDYKESEDDQEPAETTKSDAEGGLEMTEISQNRLDELLEAESELEQMKELLN